MNAQLPYLRGSVRPAYMGNHGLQQFVVTGHVLALLGFAVKLVAQLLQRLGLAESYRFK